MHQSERWASLLLRLAVAVSFIYPPISALFNPLSWIGYFPPFIMALPISDMVLLHAFGLVEIIIGVWVLFGKRIFYPSMAAAVLLIAIVVFNINQLDVLFRDIGLAFAAIALALYSRAGLAETPQSMLASSTGNSSVNQEDGLAV